MLMSGPPGTGKSMLANRFAGILPSMTEQEALESAAIQSLNGGYKLDNWKRRPFRSPHHTASGVALVGGGGIPRPGEISLAHHGVLFLDECQVRFLLSCLYAKLQVRLLFFSIKVLYSKIFHSLNKLMPKVSAGVYLKPSPNLPVFQP